MRDNGIGMSDDEIAKALMPFGQIASKMTAKHNGTGLGLPLAKAMLELHGGDLTIGSRRIKAPPRDELPRQPHRWAAARRPPKPRCCVGPGARGVFLSVRARSSPRRGSKSRIARPAAPPG